MFSIEEVDFLMGMLRTLQISPAQSDSEKVCSLTKSILKQLEREKNTRQMRGEADVPEIPMAKGG